MSLTNNDLQAISQIVDERLESKLKPIRKDIKKINHNLEKAIDHFDRADIAYEKHLDALDLHTTHPPVPVI